MSLTIARTDRTWPPIIAIDGALNTHTVGPCMEQTRDQVEGSFVLDLSGVYSCDPAGASALVELQNSVARRGDRCVFAALSYPVARTLRTTGLARLVSIYPTIEIARQRLRTSLTATSTTANGR